MGQRLVSKNVKEEKEKKNTQLTEARIWFNTIITKVTGIQYTHSLLPNEKENIVPFHVSFHLISHHLHNNLMALVLFFFLAKNPEPQKV